LRAPARIHPTVPPLPQDFQRAKEEIKLRAPIEDVVRELVPELKKAGRMWVACCPFHSEKSPSFKVDPARGTWHCYGACSEGGDQISFIERFSGVGFMDALEILAAQTGVELPKKRGNRGPDLRKDPGVEVLARVTQFYQEALQSPDGQTASRYLAERGLSRETVKAFGLGWSASSGQALQHFARQANIPFSELERCGLARKSDGGRAYDFFRGRLMIPIRDLEGRTVGFGARRLGDEGGGPKYVNTPETPFFKKSQLIYGLDQALSDSRRNRHLILVEGYTDVMAAHQVGLMRVGAVLGTSTTEQHASLVRRSGARRVSLVFDGDDAGSKAARRALHGLLGLEVDLQVVRLPQGSDPCDLLLSEGAEGFLKIVEAAPDWFADACEALEGLFGSALSEQVDDLLELVMRLKRPVDRHSRCQALAKQLGMPIEALREQWKTSAAGRRRPREAQRAAAAQQVRAAQDSQGRNSEDRNSPSQNSPGAAQARPTVGLSAEDQAAEMEMMSAAAAEGGEYIPSLPATGLPQGASSEPAAQPGAGRPHPADPYYLKLFNELIGAVLLDSSLVPLVRQHADLCADEDLVRILEVILVMYDDYDAVIDANSVLTALGDHPARKKVTSLVEHASRAASPKDLMEGTLENLRRRREGRREEELKSRFLELELNIAEAAPGAAAAAEQEQIAVLAELKEVMRQSKAPVESVTGEA
jgi:DNA primase catalytic core